ncbi:MAG: hypothetical protein B6U89_01850 [Desulfurococcales archaeon ex4484_58]|nr:MAG: hypothetical protein B6U89_01850 [Desulfurococcales archaeon ex4484_58]
MGDKVAIIHRGCGIIIDILKDLLNQYEIKYEEYCLERKKISFRELMRINSRLYNSKIILCHPINTRLIPLLKILTLIKPRKIAYIVPPDPSHRMDNYISRVIIYYTRTILTLLRSLGTKVLFIFTTPYERIYSTPLIKGFRYVYIPTYMIRDTGIKEPLHSEKPVVTFFIGEREDFLLLSHTIRVLEELGFKPRIIVNITSDEYLGCLNDYRVICIRSSEYEQLIKYSTIIVAKTPSPETNNVIAQSIIHTKPVITTMEHGLALYYRDTGLIFVLERWSGETLANSILEVLNNIDFIKKKGLALVIHELKPDYGAKILASFLE